MQAPPLLPEETLTRVCRVAKFDGLSVLLIAGPFALMSAAAGDTAGATVGLLVTGAGVMELHGRTLLLKGDRNGMDWLVRSQPALLIAILGYCAWQLLRAKVLTLPPEFDSLIQMDADQFGMTKDEFLLMAFNRVLYGGLAILTLIYQGRMTFYYLQRRATVYAALARD